MQGTILVLGGVSTNRKVLYFQLTAVWGLVGQSEIVTKLATLPRRTRPEMVLTAQILPDGIATDVKRWMRADPALADVPIVVYIPQNNKTT